MRLFIIALFFFLPLSSFASTITYQQLPDGTELVGGGPQGTSHGFRMNMANMGYTSTTTLLEIRFPLTKQNSGANACGDIDVIIRENNNNGDIVLNEPMSNISYIYFDNNQSPNPLTSDTTQWASHVLQTPIELDPNLTYKSFFTTQTSCYGAYRNAPDVHEKYHSGQSFYGSDQAIFALLTGTSTATTSPPVSPPFTVQPMPIGYNNSVTGTTSCIFTATSALCATTQLDVLATNDFGLTIGLSILIGLIVVSMTSYVFNSRKY